MNQKYRVSYSFTDGSSLVYTFPIGESGVEALKEKLITGLFQGEKWVSFNEPMTGNEVFINGSSVVKITAMIMDEEMTSGVEE
ncbi:hypothetical protein [Edaphobacillus lindanitolerans]|uniref:Uncharacterized protein n=1 Tax=Edaphobacillus lindanitolerans TaxID=550447 RepID=A0A1U7PL26_9BACI|nr:hypothetical protein [Edaphobacillus lindanitolerans]SIT66020.1 hypothetical protein SAMN05428946_0003 [Edaphobacillus lindanitolerans]